MFKDIKIRDTVYVQEEVICGCHKIKTALKNAYKAEEMLSDI